MKIIIPIEPRSKKNHSRLINVHGRPMLIPSKPYVEFEKACKPYMPTINEPINYPINVKCLFYMKTRRKVDISNLISAISDVLVKYKVIEDDNRNIIASYDGSLVFYDKEYPHIEVEITKKENYEQW